MYNSDWYLNLTKPPLAPPDSIFTPVWAVLYFTMLCSLCLYFYTKNENKTNGYVFFAWQFVLNILWSPVFFLMKNMHLALVIVILMAIFTFLTIKEFCKTSKIAGLILIPYLIWILFAAYLNLGYIILN